MTPDHAIKKSFSKYASFSGYASRPEFWWTWGLLYPVIQFVTFARSQPFTGPVFDTSATVLVCLLAIPMIAVGTRRLADAGVWRWFFVLVFVFGVLAQILYAIPVPNTPHLENLMVQFDDVAVPASDIGYYPYLRVAHDIMPWVGRPLAFLCLLLALLPSRKSTLALDTLKVTQ